MDCDSDGSAVTEGAHERAWPVPAAMATLMHQVLPSNGCKVGEHSSAFPRSRVGQEPQVASFPWQSQESHGTSLQVTALEEMLALLLQQHDKVVGCFEDCISGHQKILRRYKEYQGSDRARLESPEVSEGLEAPQALRPPEAPDAPEALEMPESSRTELPKQVLEPQAFTVTKFDLVDCSPDSAASHGSDLKDKDRKMFVSFTRQIDDEDQKAREAAQALCESSKGCSSQGSDYVHYGCLGRFVHSSSFEYFVALAIFTNAMLIGVETHFMAVHHMDDIPLGFKITGWTYGFIFFVELSLRMMSEGYAFFKAREWYWNWFDLFCVAASVVEVILELMAADAGLENTNVIRIARMVRTIRLSRTLRITSVVRFVNALQVLVSSIASTLKSLVWALVLMLVIVYSCGIMFTQATTAHLVQIPGPHGDSDLHKFWGTLGKSMATLYQSVTGGISWRDASTPLSQVNWIWEGLFMAYVSFTYFAVLNVVTGVFCNSAIDNAKHEPEMVISSLLSDQHWYETHLKKLFLMLDKDKSGAINIRELEKCMDNESVRHWFAAMGLEISDAWSLFKLIDEDRSHDVSSQEFVSRCMHLRGYARSIDLALLRQEHSSMLRKMLQAATRIEKMFSDPSRDMLRSTGQSAQSISSKTKALQNQASAMSRIAGSPNSSKPKVNFT